MENVPLMGEADFQIDVVARVAICGWIETGIEGVVYLTAGERATARYVPVLTESVASQWPPEMRLRISAMIIDDQQQHFFIVSREADEYKLSAIRRDTAEQIVVKSNLARLAKRVPQSGD